MRGLMVAMLCGMAIGCGSNFRSEIDELAYLSSLSNPTIDQWNRRNQLTDKAHYEESHRVAEMVRKRDRAEPEAPKADEHERLETEALNLMNRARSYEEKGMPGPASLCYKEVVEKYPQSSFFAHATLRQKQCEAIAYPEPIKP